MVRAASWITVRLGFLLVPLWVVAAVAAAHYLPSIDESLASPLGGLVPGGASAITAQAREEQLFGSTVLTRIVVVQHAGRPLGRAQLRRTAAVAVAVDRHRSPALGHVAFAAPLVSPDRTTTITYLYFEPAVPANAQLALAKTYAERLDPPGLRTGALPARTSEFDRIQHALPRVTLATIALVLLVLLLTFRAPGPALVVLAAAGIAYTISVHLLAWLGRHEHRTVPKEVEPILIALLLGLLTDYSVFFLTGVRRRLAEGRGRFEAALETTRENLPIVLTAGLIVALGSLTLVVGQLDVFRSFGPGMALTVLVTVAVALTFVPGLLALLGPATFWPSGSEPAAPSELRARAWRLLTARPASALLALLVTAALAIASLGLLQARLGFTLISGQPPGAEVKVAAGHAARGFAPGIVSPTEVLLEGNLGNRRSALVRFEQALDAVPGRRHRDRPARAARPAGPAALGRAQRQGGEVRGRLRPRAARLTGDLDLRPAARTRPGPARPRRASRGRTCRTRATRLSRRRR